MAPTILYTSSLLGAIALYLLLRPGVRSVKVVGALLGLGALAWVVRESAAGADERPALLFVLFSLIAIGAAVRMITHHRPVYAALYFVLVVLSSAGLFLLLEAEFMAFALIIVYAGAILITYLFVLMLAQQAQSDDDPESQPEYDRVPREPAAAVVVGFVMLALLGDVIFAGAPELRRRPTRMPCGSGRGRSSRRFPIGWRRLSAGRRGLPPTQPSRSVICGWRTGSPSSRSWPATPPGRERSSFPKRRCPRTSSRWAWP